MFVTQLTVTQRREERTTCFSAKQTSWSPSSLYRWNPQNNRQTRKKSEDRERISIFCFSVIISMTLTKLKIKRTKTRAKYALSSIYLVFIQRVYFLCVLTRHCLLDCLCLFFVLLGLEGISLSCFSFQELSEIEMAKLCCVLDVQGAAKKSRRHVCFNRFLQIIQ